MIALGVKALELFWCGDLVADDKIGHQATGMFGIEGNDFEFAVFLVLEDRSYYGVGQIFQVDGF